MRAEISSEVSAPPRPARRILQIDQVAAAVRCVAAFPADPGSSSVKKHTAELLHHGAALLRDLTDLARENLQKPQAAALTGLGPLRPPAWAAAASADGGSVPQAGGGAAGGRSVGVRSPPGLAAGDGEEDEGKTAREEAVFSLWRLDTVDAQVRARRQRKRHGEHGGGGGRQGGGEGGAAAERLVQFERREWGEKAAEAAKADRLAEGRRGAGAGGRGLIHGIGELFNLLTGESAEEMERETTACLRGRRGQQRSSSERCRRGVRWCCCSSPDN